MPLNRLIFYEQLQNLYAKATSALRRNLNVKQQKILNKIIMYDRWNKFKHIDASVKKLKSLGFTDQPLRELNFFLADSELPKFKKAAGLQLLRWYAYQNDLKSVQKCLELLPIVKDGETNLLNIKQNAVIEAECYLKIKDFTAGQLVIEKALERIGPNADLFLAMANFETNFINKLEWINKAFKIHGMAPLLLDKDITEPSIGLMKEGVIENKAVNDGCDLPLVSIIVAVYNDENSLGLAIESLRKQTWPNLEILVVDDGSNDNTVSVIEKFCKMDGRIKLIRSRSNHGPYYSRNIALNIAAGEFVTLHDADDWSHPEKIETQARHLLSNSAIVGNTSRMARVDSALNFLRGNIYGDLIANFKCSFMFRRKIVMERVGFWDSVRFSADSEYIRRIMKAFGSDSVVSLETGPLSFYHKGRNSLTGSEVFGYPGFYMGARKEYFEAQSYFHNKATNLFFAFPQKDRPFPVPEPMWVKRETVCSSGRRKFDLVFGADFRKQDRYTKKVAEIIAGYSLGNKRIGLFQLSDYNYDPDENICSMIRDLLDCHNVQMLVYGEKIICDYLFIMDPLTLEEKQRYIPDIKTDDIRVIFNNPKLLKVNRKVKLNNSIIRSNNNLKECFGRDGIWHLLKHQELNRMNDEGKSTVNGVRFSVSNWYDLLN